MNEVYIDLRCDDELQEIFTNKDFISVEELRNKLVDLFNQLNSEEDNYDEYKDQCLEEELR
jgi:hypothetical protein